MIHDRSLGLCIRIFRLDNIIRRIGEGERKAGPQWGGTIQYNRSPTPPPRLPTSLIAPSFNATASASP